MQLPDDLAVTLLGIYAREVEVMFTQNLYTDVCNIFIPNSSKLETTEMSFRQTVVSPDHGILLSNEGDELLTPATTWRIMLSDKRQSHKLLTI